MARRKPFKGFKDLTFLNFAKKNFDYSGSAAFASEDWSKIPSRLLDRVNEATNRLKLSELPPKQREALEVNVRRAVSVVDLATEHQKVFPAQQMEFKDTAKKLRLAAKILNEEREQFHQMLRERPSISADEHLPAFKPTVARSSVSDTVGEAERLADLYEQSAACASERRDRAKYLAALHAWYLLMDVREVFWANECGDTKDRVNFESAYWQSRRRLKRLPGLQPGGVWHLLAGDLYGDTINFEYLQNLHVPLRKAGRGLQAFWEKRKNSGTTP